MTPRDRLLAAVASSPSSIALTARIEELTFPTAEKEAAFWGWIGRISDEALKVSIQWWHDHFADILREGTTPSSPEGLAAREGWRSAIRPLTWRSEFAVRDAMSQIFHFPRE